MVTVLENIKALYPFLIGVWAVLIISVIWKPQKLRNSFLLMIALFYSMFFMAGVFGDGMGIALLIEFLLVMFILMLVPLILMWNGYTMIRKEGRSFGHMLSLLLGLVIGTGEIASIGYILNGAFNVARDVLGNSWKLFFFVGTSVLYFSVVLLAFVLYMVFIQIMPHRMNYDYVIIHGCGLIHGNRISKLLSNRVDKAIEIFHRCKKKPMLIPSGGKGSDEDISEAEAIRQYLQEHGISEEYILMEDKSTTTMENLKYSKALIDQREGGKRIALISSNYHIYRCMVYASRLKLRCTGIGAKVALYFWPSAIIREFVAVFSEKGYMIRILFGYALLVLLPSWYIIFKI